MSKTDKRPATEAEFEALRSRLAGLSHSEKVSLAAKTRPIAENRAEKTKTVIVRNKVPQNDDEFHQWVIDHTGFDIPRTSVCEDHDPPFKFLADAFFEREQALFLLGSREQGKTLMVSILHYANSELKPGTESLTFGAIEPQAKRAYKHLRSFLYDEEYNPDGTVTRSLSTSIEGDPLRSETRWKNGSLMEIVVGSKSGVNSPHPQKVHADEVDLMDEEIWEESRSMSSAKTLRDGTRIEAQDLATSTRKSMVGLVQKILDEVDDAEAKGLEPSWRVYRSCVFENAEEVPCCQRAPAEEREARLQELGRDPTELCSCDKTAKGEIADDVPRTLASVCKGRFFKSRGWMAHKDVKRKFRANSPAYWGAQMECRRPMADGLYLEGWSRERFSTVGWQPKPEFGNIWQSVDWGGSAFTFILWSQGPLRVPVTIEGPTGPLTVPFGSYVVFDELYEANTGATRFADMVVAKEIGWRRQIPGFRVTARFADMAGKQQRDDWREHNPSLPTVWWLPNRDKEPTIATLQGLVVDKHYWVDSRCSRHMDDIESWRQAKGKEVHDQSSHSPAASRYLHANVEARERRKQHQSPRDKVMPAVVARPTDSSLAGVAVGNSDPFADERAWRSSLGEHFPENRPFGR